MSLCICFITLPQTSVPPDSHLVTQNATSASKHRESSTVLKATLRDAGEALDEQLGRRIAVKADERGRSGHAAVPWQYEVASRPTLTEGCLT